MTAISNTELRRYYLVHQILSVKDEQLLAQIETWFSTLLPATDTLPSFVKPLQKKTTVEFLQEAQNYKGFDFTTFSKLSQAFDTEENTEDLLAMLSLS
jgi:hypothetical protein